MKVLGIHTLILLMLCSVVNVFAQSESSAKALLDKVSKNYASFKTIKADFDLVGDASQDNSNYKNKGRVYLVPGTGKYKIEMDNQALISDGKTQWSVLKDIGEVQVTDVNPNDQSINPANIFNFYKEGYKMTKLADTKVSGTSLAVVELSPTDQNQNVLKIQMRIDKANNFIYDATVFDKSGNQYTYSLTNIETNKTFSTGIFNFYKHNYPGIEVVDLR